jgi:hypothetical protein
LDLVKRDGKFAPDKRLGIAPGEIDNVEIIEGEVSPFSLQEISNQCALARLPCAGHDNGRHHRKTLGQAWSNHAGLKNIIHTLNDIHLRRESQPPLHLPMASGRLDSKRASRS